MIDKPDLEGIPPLPAHSDSWPLGLVTSPMYWSSSELVQRLGMDHAASTPMLEDTFLAKAFAGAMHPTRIIPFYYRATGKIEEEDVTITTLVTSNRFKVFRQLVERYQGPISVTIHIPFPSQASLSSLPATHPSVKALQSLHALYTSSPHFATYVDVHLALSPFAAPASTSRGKNRDADEDDGEGVSAGGRQFNLWRNAARLFARTEFVMMLDVDFAVCTDWRSALRDALCRVHPSDSALQSELDAQLEAGLRMGVKTSLGFKVDEGQEATTGNAALNTSTMDIGNVELVQKLREGRAALVVPAFEYVRQEDGMDQRSFPTDKETLLLLTRAAPPLVEPFHAAWAAGHNSTDYAQYDALPPRSGTVYRVTTYQSAYEPYVIVSRRATWCDERFTGYGANKAACLFEMYLSGVSFYVLADHFVMHQSHTYEEQARREERKYNRKLYADFKEEMCLRYLHRYALEGTLHTPRGFNVQEECKKIKNGNVARFAAQLLDVAN
ncbi:glycosyltransferase family 49 protein [Sparassis crispa]|uniref:Glycosyltransferase family 49 protein n=1 Tax=Sparassis crispa TaxID=139825 RepID=A0A401GFV2_9APHY|nr:glycosyltransferase family 49 protein [Sparassis crispa]GBE81042.1 glycosyltransferase family 49 protein [Sparassis crispa]